MEYVPLTKESAEILKEVIVEKQADYLTLLCLAIRDFEGKPGDRNYRNNNPGNCRYSSVGYDPMYGVVKRDPQNFAIFKDYETGWLYLQNLIKSKARKNPEWSIATLMKEYAPESDGNSPSHYASYIGKRMGVNPFVFKLKELI